MVQICSHCTAEEYLHKHLQGSNVMQMMSSPVGTDIVESLVPNVCADIFIGALVESSASEHNSRMMAMKTAKTVQREMLHDLEIEYNRVRQAAITQEITEVSCGAKAQKTQEKIRQVKRMNKGKIVQVMGPVVDVEFSDR